MLGMEKKKQDTNKTPISMSVISSLQYYIIYFMNGIIVLLYRETRYFGVVLSSNSLISCSFTLAKCLAILLFFSLLIGYEVIAYYTRKNA